MRRARLPEEQQERRKGEKERGRERGAVFVESLEVGPTLEEFAGLGFVPSVTGELQRVDLDGILGWVDDFGLWLFHGARERTEGLSVCRGRSKQSNENKRRRPRLK